MKYIAIASLMLSHSLFAMDSSCNQTNIALSKKLQDIICYGTLDDFKQQQLDFTTELNDNALNTANMYCDWHLTAIEAVTYLQTNAVINDFVIGMEKNIAKLLNKDEVYKYLKYNHENGCLAGDHKKAVTILKAIHFKNAGPFIMALREKLKTTKSQADQIELLAQEQEKIRFIQNAIMEMF